MVYNAHWIMDDPGLGQVATLKHRLEMLPERMEWLPLRTRHMAGAGDWRSPKRRG